MEIYSVFVLSLFMIVNHGRVTSMPRQPRLSLAEPMPYYFNNQIDGHPGTYSYGYDVKDPATGNNQFRTEERYPNGTVIGSYGYIDAWGKPLRYRYIADERGYRVMRDPPYRPYREPYPLYPAPVSPSGFISESSAAPYPAQPSMTWSRPKKPHKKKNSGYYINRPQHNFIGPPSSYAED